MRRIADVFQAKGLRVFGPNKHAARLEGSKVFAKRFLLKYRVPTATAEVFDKADKARAHLRKVGAPIVVKADGLAAGKGVIVAQSVEEAEKAIAEIMEQQVFGEAGAQLIVEECLRGEELSVMALVDGKSFQMLASAQDHKRALDGDGGPNTGGMGAYSPTPLLNDKLKQQIADVFRRTLAGLQAESIEYRGVLYAGLMITERGPQVLEFNCRFGDPETQAVLPRMDFDLIEAVEATINGTLDRLTLKWTSDAAVCVVMAAGGYPGHYERGQSIEGLKEASQLDKVYVFHAGTRRDASGLVTDGGRVLGVTALGANIEQAARRAYEAVDRDQPIVDHRGHPDHDARPPEPGGEPAPPEPLGGDAHERHAVARGHREEGQAPLVARRVHRHEEVKEDEQAEGQRRDGPPRPLEADVVEAFEEVFHEDIITLARPARPPADPEVTPPTRYWATCSSTRRFLALLTGPMLGTRGFSDPWPVASTRPSETPFLTR